LKFRRPLRVGSNLTVTLQAKIIVIAAILGLITAISLAISLPCPDQEILLQQARHPPFSPPFYALLIVLFLFTSPLSSSYAQGTCHLMDSKKLFHRSVTLVCKSALLGEVAQHFENRHGKYTPVEKAR